jgi:hypothetical protein
MQALCRTLTGTNIEQITTEYCAAVEAIGDSIINARGRRLLEILKRDVVRVGPYPQVTLFEAANRIMSDLVILHGIKWLLDRQVFPFDSYLVEFGNEDKNGFDIQAGANGLSLIGEAFNVAPTFFQTKKNKMLHKLRLTAATADFKIIMFNHDAISAKYTPKLDDNEYYLVVDIGTGGARLVPATPGDGLARARSKSGGAGAGSEPGSYCDTSPTVCLS